MAVFFSYLSKNQLRQSKAKVCHYFKHNSVSKVYLLAYVAFFLPPTPHSGLHISAGVKVWFAMAVFTSSMLDRQGKEGVNDFWQATRNCCSFSSWLFLWLRRDQHNKMLLHWNGVSSFPGRKEEQDYSWRISSIFALSLTHLRDGSVAELAVGQGTWTVLLS